MPLVICNVELSEDFNSAFVITFPDPEDSTLFMPEILLIKFTISLYDFVVWVAESYKEFAISALDTAPPILLPLIVTEFSVLFIRSIIYVPLISISPFIGSNPLKGVSPSPIYRFLLSKSQNG